MNTNESKYRFLKQFFGYDSFRSGQEALIDAILAGRDCLGVMPTGAGKSLCFQIPALMLEGTALVISPLISLMKDQVGALKLAGVKAAYINSSLSANQISQVLRNAWDGMYRIIYVAPERLESAEFLDYAKNAQLSLLSVDEAHCVSQWGQDFRPAYLKIASFLSALPRRPAVAAFTATATPEVRGDIIRLLELRSPEFLVTGFDRKNLYFSVSRPDDKFEALLNFLRERKEKSGIIYCATRKNVDEIFERLNGLGFSAARYHAGMLDGDRHESQDNFLYDRVRIMVATNAFGMGIDKSNVAYVLHYNMPKDIESYYQEAGRAGRDGGPADCALFFNGQDIFTNMYLIDNDKAEYPDAETEKAIKERDRKRLKIMTGYCRTNDCLRAYILRYFDEKSGDFCDNCSNCHTDFVTSDVTVEAQKILSCVVRLGEKYGVKMLIDVLQGKNTERIRRLGLDKLSTYNISDSSENRLRDIINHLAFNDFLIITNDDYPIVKRGSMAVELLKGAVTIEMKLTLDKSAGKQPRAKKYSKTAPVDKILFEKLRGLRKEIAAEEGVPSFVVFSDSTLTDMCMKLPADENELLDVSGIGQVKLERYGKRFLRTIAEFSAQRENQHPQGENNPAAPNSSGGLSAESPEVIEATDEAVTVSVIADRLNCLFLQRDLKKTTGAKINEWLLSQGYLKLSAGESGKTFRVASENGLSLGISTEEREIRGEKCFINYFDKAAQEFVLEGFLKGQ